MLVLTTMFINVSNSLPKTSYMKMVDDWLLFNLLYPFIVVLIHTYMDTLRDDEDREINHHGKTVSINGEPEEKEQGGISIKVIVVNHSGEITSCSTKVKPANMNLVSVNEKEELKAQKEFYDKIHKQMGEKRKKKLEFWRRTSLVYLPVMALIFVCLYWLIGLKSAGVL